MIKLFLTRLSLKKKILFIFVIFGLITAILYVINPSFLTSWRPIKTTSQQSLPVPQKTALPHQFQGKNGPFVLLAENTPLSLQPKANKTTKKTLALSQRVRAIARQGEWIFVTGELGHPNLGWVDQNSLAFPQNFRPEKWMYGPYSYTKSMFSGNVHPKPDGRFLVIWTAKGNGLSLKGRYQGKVMAYDGLIWLKKDNVDDLFDFFYIDTNTDLLKPEQKYTLN